MASHSALLTLSRNSRRSIGSSVASSPHHLHATSSSSRGLLLCEPCYRTVVRFSSGLDTLSHRRNHPINTRAFTSTAPFAASPAKQTTPSSSTMALDKVLTPGFLKSVRDFWYEHLPSDDDLVIPGQVAHQRWYAGGAEFDKACLTQFEPALDAIQASGLDGAGLLRLARPTTPCSWLGLVLLLDQMPRNCYRGAAARVVFSVFDPIALAVAQAAVAAGVPHEAPEMRWQLAFRTWFYLPYEHTEDAAMHDECRRQCEGLARDVEALLAEGEEDEGPNDAYRRRAWRVVHREPKAARALVQAQLDFARRHEDIIKQFGRYPHRNEALGRETTAEEKAFLEGGGDTFQSK